MKILKLLFLLGLIIGSSGASAATEITRYHVDDKLTQSSLILDEVGNVISRERLKSFGGVEHSTRDTEEWQHSYHGKQRHTSHGLVDFGARFYDPEIGRFISMDPRGFRESSPDSFNRYAFANNNPYRYTDPDGRVVETAWDVANVGFGLASLSSNLSGGNWSAAALDTAGLAYDGLASVIPFLPGGASAGIKAGRAVDSAASAAKSADVTKGGSKALRPVGQILESVDDVMVNPQLLKGLNPAQLMSRINKSDNWVVGTMKKSRSENKGFTLRELNNKGTDFTDRYIQYHPGSRRHFNGQPYWKVSSGSGGTVRFPVDGG